MKKPEVKAALSAALGRSETTDPAEVLRQLMEASQQDDAALGAAVRRQFSVIGLCLLAISWGVDARMTRRPRGRPSVAPLGDLDCRRAFCAWCAVNLIGNRQMSNLQAIKLCSEIEEIDGTLEAERLFKHADQASLEQSVSRGRTKVGMADGPDDRWQSAPFDEWQAGYTSPDC